MPSDPNRAWQARSLAHVWHSCTQMQRTHAAPPLRDDWDSAALAFALGLPVLLVVGLRLCCINHAQLTAETIRASGLRLCGWGGNTIDLRLPHVAQNLDALGRGLGSAPCPGLVPRLPEPAPYLNVPALHTLFNSTRISDLENE